MLGDKRLVGGDHVPAGGDGRLADLLGDAIGAADQFDHHLGVGLGGHGRSVVVPGEAVQRHGPALVPRARRYGADHDGPAAQPFEGTGMCLQHLEGADPDRAQAGDGDLQRPAHRAALSWPARMVDGFRQMRRYSCFISYPCPLAELEGSAHPVAARIGRAIAGPLSRRYRSRRGDCPPRPTA